LHPTGVVAGSRDGSEGEAGGFRDGCCRIIRHGRGKRYPKEEQQSADHRQNRSFRDIPVSQQLPPPCHPGSVLCARIGIGCGNVPKIPDSSVQSNHCCFCRRNHLIGWSKKSGVYIYCRRSKSRQSKACVLRDCGLQDCLEDIVVAIVFESFQLPCARRVFCCVFDNMLVSLDCVLTCDFFIDR